MLLTSAMLEQVGACQKQLTLFRERFPKGCIPTAELCRQFPDFDYAWAAGKLLQQRAAFDAAMREHWTAYQAARDQQWTVYEAAIAPHQAEYRASGFTRWAEYEAAVRPHALAYAAVRDELLAGYAAAVAETFGRMWEEQCSSPW